MVRNGRKLGIGILLALLLTAAVSPASAKGGDVEFHGTLTKVDNTATPSITLRVAGLDVKVSLTPDTEVELHGDEIGLAGLHVGDFVKVIGFFANSGITAREIVIIDQGDGEFRFRGHTTAVKTTASGTLVSLLGVDVLVNDDTKIERRGPEGGFTASNLTADLNVDVTGIHQDGRFIATRLKVGNREDDLIRVQFNGKIASLGTGTMNVDTEGGGVAVVLINAETKVTGTPAVGMFADVRGTLNSSLQVVASHVVVKASRDEDDPETGSGSANFDKRITISPVGANSNVQGKAHVSLEEIEVDFERGEKNTIYNVRVDVAGVSSPVVLGTAETNPGGRGELKITLPASGAPLPSGKTVRDITKVQILFGSTVVAEGVF